MRSVTFQNHIDKNNAGNRVDNRLCICLFVLSLRSRGSVTVPQRRVFILYWICERNCQQLLAEYGNTRSFPDRWFHRFFSCNFYALAKRMLNKTYWSRGKIGFEAGSCYSSIGCICFQSWSKRAQSDDKPYDRDGHAVEFVTRTILCLTWIPGLAGSSVSRLTRQTDRQRSSRLS